MSTGPVEMDLRSDGYWYCEGCDKQHPVQPCCGDYKNCVRCCLPRRQAISGVAIKAAAWCMKCDQHSMECSCLQWPTAAIEAAAAALAKLSAAEHAADAILALINDSPRTPTREAVAKVVAENMPAVTINRHPTEEQMKREDAAYLRGCREAEEKAKLINALRVRNDG